MRNSLNTSSRLSWKSAKKHVVTAPALGKFNTCIDRSIAKTSVELERKYSSTYEEGVRNLYPSISRPCAIRMLALQVIKHLVHPGKWIPNALHASVTYIRMRVSPVYLLTEACRCKEAGWGVGVYDWDPSYIRQRGTKRA